MRGKAGPHYKWPWPPPRQGQTRYKRVQAYDSIFVQDSMTKGPNSPDAKRPRGGRSPVPDDADMTDKPQLKIPDMRGRAAEVVVVATETRRLGRPRLAGSQH